jgi:hypothetical protein
VAVDHDLYLVADVELPAVLSQMSWYPPPLGVDEDAEIGPRATPTVDPPRAAAAGWTSQGGGATGHVIANMDGRVTSSTNTTDTLSPV